MILENENSQFFMQEYLDRIKVNRLFVQLVIYWYNYEIVKQLKWTLLLFYLRE